MVKVVTYQRLTDDIVTAPNQKDRLPANYCWKPTSVFRFKADLVYAGAWLFAQGYCRIGVPVRHRSVLRQAAVTRVPQPVPLRLVPVLPVML
ncbi:hypothetical protein PZ01_10980 [Lacticaseibacillus rhamnosus]|nr:hypothetical protein PZ01_10980 [Lacticaseibacillus rhamnosus]